MTGIEYEKYLYNQISKEEWHVIFYKPQSLIISNHNLNVLKSLREHVLDERNELRTKDKKSEKTRSEEVKKKTLLQEIDLLKAERLSQLLKVYLDIYMKEKPEGHKWIIIASLYLAIVQKLPMHPMDFLHIQKIEEADKITYLCPMKDMTEGCICEYCICEKADSSIRM